MALRRSFTAGLACFVVAAALAGTVPGTAVAAASGSPTEAATLAAPQVAAYRQDVPLVAGESGFLHQEQGTNGYVWTDYASGTDTVQAQLAGLTTGSVKFMSAGGDLLAYQQGTTLTVGDPVTGTWTDYSLPQSGQVGTVVAGVGVDGTRAIVHQGDGAHLLQLNADGTVSDVAVTGLPTDPGYTTTVTGFQGPGDVVVLRGTGAAGSGLATRQFLLRLDTAAAYPVPATVLVGTSPRVSGGYLLWEGSGLNALKVDDVIAGTVTTPVTVANPTGAAPQDFAVVGGQLVVLAHPASSIAEALYSVPLDGGPAVQLDSLVSQSPSAMVTREPYLFVEGAGGLLTVGGSTTSQAVQQFTAAADGSLDTTAVLRLQPPAESAATLSMVQGQVRQVLTIPQVGAATQFMMSTTPLAGPAANVGKTLTGYLYNGGQPFQAGPCAVDESCVRETDGSFYGPVYTTTTATSASVFVSELQEHFSSPDTRVVDADYEYVVIDSAGTQHLWDPGQDRMITLGAANGAALWMGTLWRATAPGVIQASIPQVGLGATPAVKRTISTGTSCTPSEVQVSQHWLYWSCGSSGPAGVYDLATNVKFSVDSGPALLGDGYLVRHDAADGELLLTDVHTDSVGATSVLAALPAEAGVSDDRGIDWAVDRSSGDVAYAGADNTVHVLVTGVPASTVTAVGGTWSDSIMPDGSVPWGFYFFASRPLASWQLVIRRAATKQVVFTHIGGPTTDVDSVQWNGLLTNKKAAFNGGYDWQLLAVPADAPGTAPVQAATGTTDVIFGRMPFHSYGVNGMSTLLGVLKQSAFGYGYGYGMEYTGNGHGGYFHPYASSNWNIGNGSGQVNAIVPFGDLNGDGFNDFIVRTSRGELEYYPNQMGGDVLNNTKAKAISGGWNQYNQLVSVGDLNGDGHDDLLARDKSGELWMYPGNGKGGFGTRVALGKYWKSYTRLVGVGDVNEDGAGDLLAIDSSGRAWRYLGNGKGHFGTRVEVGTGFQAYNAVVGVGDVNGQGLDSVVARDTHGVLWRYDFTASGSLRSRVRVGSGWNVFSGLY